jgi:PIN domain nuclease of toxin-antitoxin system
MIGKYYVARLLLDTHIWLWSLLEPHKLFPSVASALEDDENELWLSPISIWELVMLHGKRRMLLNTDLETWLHNAWGKKSFREAAITFEVTREMARVSLPHRDPADHFLVATARIFELTLVTADQHLLKAPGISVLSNS